MQAALDQIPERVPSIDYGTGDRPGSLHGCTLEELFQLLNVAIQAPPSFLPSTYMGTPFSVILIDMMNTEMGKAVFARTDVNEFLKLLLD